MDQDFGGFDLQSSSEVSGVEGRVTDGVVPISVLEERMAEGDCRLMRRNNPFCDPACDPGQTCDFDGTCLPYPSNQDLGTVTLLGIGEAVVMEPVFPGNTYFNTSLPTPPFVGGELMTLQMPDGVYGPVELYGVGVEMLHVLDDQWTLNSGQKVEVSWDPPAGPVVRSDVHLTLSIDQHGATPGVVQCVFDDDGSGEVPSSVLDALISAGVTGFPSGSLIRQTADKTTAGQGCMDFRVSSPVEVDVDVVGFTPCWSTADCPEGLVCNVEMQICE